MVALVGAALSGGLALVAGVGWAAICAIALRRAYRSGAMPGRVGVIRRDRRPAAFALSLAFTWLALLLGLAAAGWGVVRLI
jgi:hypothetical protein